MLQKFCEIVKIVLDRSQYFRIISHKTRIALCNGLAVRLGTGRRYGIQNGTADYLFTRARGFVSGLYLAVRSTAKTRIGHK